MKLTRSVFLLIILVTGLISCKDNKKKPQFTGSSRYDFSNPSATIKLPDGLAEISGIVYYPKDTTVFAIKDEDGLFYKIYLNKKDYIKKWRYDKKHDFEDLVLLDSIFYVMISNGNIITVQFGAGDTIMTDKSKFPEGSKAVNEFEAMYYDDSLRQMVLLCKNCEGDGKKIVTAWGYDPTTRAYKQAIFTIDAQPIAEKLGLEKIELKPSAAAINPITNEVYVLASVNKLLVVMDRYGKYKDLFELDPAIYRQPEGISFTPSGDLIISNEASETGLANILIIRNKKKGS